MSIIIGEKVRIEKKQSEHLLKKLDSILKKKNIKISQMETIFVVNKGGRFSSLRIGINTANTLGFSLGIPAVGTDKFSNKDREKNISKLLNINNKISNYSIVFPVYLKEPNIT